MKASLEGVESHIDLSPLQGVSGVEDVVAGRVDTLSGEAGLETWLVTITWQNLVLRGKGKYEMLRLRVAEIINLPRCNFIGQIECSIVNKL